MKYFTIIILFTVNVLFAQSNYNFNQAYNFGKYIEDGSWKIVGGEAKVEVTKISTGKKDVEGNEVFKFHVKGENTDIYLAPDNYNYPLMYRELFFDSPLYGYRRRSGSEGYIVLNENHIARVSMSFGKSLPNDNVQHPRIYMSVDNFQELGQKLETPFSSKSLIRGSGKGSPYNKWTDFMKDHNMKCLYGAGNGTPATQYPGILEYHRSQKKYYDQVLEDAKGIGFNKLMEEFTDGEYCAYGDWGNHHSSVIINGENKTETGPVKISFKRNENGAVTEIVFQSCFTDGKFYDKDKFYNKLSISGDAIVGKDLFLLPFDGRLLIYTTLRGEISAIVGVISRDPQDVTASFIAQWKFWHLSETDHAFWCAEEFETKYDKNKDNYLFGPVIKKYWSVIKAK